MSTSKRFVGEVVELSRDCELGQEAERAVVTALITPYMTLTFLDRAPDCRDVHTGADYKYLRPYAGVYAGLVDPELAAVSINARRKKPEPKASRAPLQAFPSLLSDTFWDHLRAAVAEPPGPAIPDDLAFEMFGCRASAIDQALAGRSPRGLVQYALSTLSNAQDLIRREGAGEWAVTTSFAANTIRQFMNIAKYALDRAVPQEAPSTSPEETRELHARVQAMVKKFRGDCALRAFDDKSPYDDNNLEDAFVLLEQLALKALSATV